MTKWGAPPAVIMDVVNVRHKLAKSIERTVTALLRRVAKASEHKAMLKGLDNRLKSKASLTRKVLERLDGASGLEREEIEKTVHAMHDVLRYTMVIPTQRYTKAVSSIVAALEKVGYSTIKCKNYWVKEGEAADYMGINCIFHAPGMPEILDPFTFELQFHTMQSLDTKMQRCHHSYAKFRESRSLVRAQYWEEMVRMWALVPIPKGVHSIGELAAHEMNLGTALTDLTAEEQKVITQQRALEDVVRPMCEAAVAKTMLAEKRVTPTLRMLATELNFTLHGLDFRVKSALSMARKAVSRLVRAY